MDKKFFFYAFWPFFLFTLYKDALVLKHRYLIKSDG